MRVAILQGLGGPMRRREFIVALGGAASAWPLRARAQTQEMPVIGYLHTGSAHGFASLVTAFRRGLAEVGYVEGRSVALESRYANDQADRLPELAADLVQRQVNVIVAAGNPEAALAAKAATAKIPIVFVSGMDPVRIGLVASLNRPGGNVTGITSLTADLSGKRLGLLQVAAPGAARIGVLVGGAAYQDSIVADVKAAASAIGLQIEFVSVGYDRDLEAAFAGLRQKQIAAMLISADAMFISRRVELALLAIKYSVTAIYPFRENTEAGGLMSYGPDTPEINRQGGSYAGRILRGEKPADLPVVQSSKFEFIINLQVARVTGFEVPGTLLAIADEVIE
jgi:putative tryptophan/tyrosine transport system substrate-binding protein